MPYVSKFRLFYFFMLFKNTHHVITWNSLSAIHSVFVLESTHLCSKHKIPRINSTFLSYISDLISSHNSQCSSNCYDSRPIQLSKLTINFIIHIQTFSHSTKCPYAICVYQKSMEMDKLLFLWQLQKKGREKYVEKETKRTCITFYFFFFPYTTYIHIGSVIFLFFSPFPIQVDYEKMNVFIWKEFIYCIRKSWRKHMSK